MIQNTKSDFQGLANSINGGSGPTDGDRPLTHYHSFFHDLFTVSFLYDSYLLGLAADVCEMCPVEIPSCYRIFLF